MYRIEAITLPVSDVDRAKAFYEQVGCHLDLDADIGPGIFASPLFAAVTLDFLRE